VFATEVSQPSPNVLSFLGEQKDGINLHNGECPEFALIIEFEKVPRQSLGVIIHQTSLHALKS
jgi:hypothetical protein